MRTSEEKRNRLFWMAVAVFYIGAVLALFGCASTTGDPYGEGVPCYEGPLIVEKITPTPTPTNEGGKK